jgi:hypothetical protein
MKFSKSKEEKDDDILLNIWKPHWLQKPPTLPNCGPRVTAEKWALDRSLQQTSKPNIRNFGFRTNFYYS